MDMIKDPGEIEKRSMEIIEENLPELMKIPAQEREIIKRVIHTTGDFSCASLVKITSGAVEAGLAALRKGKPIMTDVNMLKAGLMTQKMQHFGIQAYCLISDPEVISTAKKNGITRAMAAMKKGAINAQGGIIAVGNAPTALFTLCNMIKEGEANPALVVGTPVGFVGAAESKDFLLECGVECITMPGTRGGSTIAASIINALLLMA